MSRFSIRPPIFSSSLHRYGAERSPGIQNEARESGKIERNKRAGKLGFFPVIIQYHYVHRWS